MMALKLITPPSVEPVTLTEVKAHLRVDHTDDDTLIGTLISVVRQYLDGPDGWLQRALITQTWDLYLDKFPCREINIPLPPLQSVTSILYDNDNGNETTLAEDNYTTDSVSHQGWILPATSWPTTFNGVNSVRIRFVAGYPASEDSPPDLRANVPLPIKQWMLLTIGTLYAQREAVLVNANLKVETIPFFESLIQPYRVYK